LVLQSARGKFEEDSDELHPLNAPSDDATAREEDVAPELQVSPQPLAARSIGLETKLCWWFACPNDLTELTLSKLIFLSPWPKPPFSIISTLDVPFKYKSLEDGSDANILWLVDGMLCLADVD
jgi:hypothetical protein